MKTRFFTTAFAVMTLLFTFDSCREDEDVVTKFTEDEISKLNLLEDGHVFTNRTDITYSAFYNNSSSSLRHPSNMFFGTSIDEMTQMSNIQSLEIKPFTKYYWKLVDGWNGRVLEPPYTESDVRSFYYIPLPTITDIHNVSGDWATVIKWENNDVYEGGQVTMTPDKDCNYDKTPIEVPVGQDSCYISAGDLGNPKYQIYHNWWDEANGKYYEPVVYDYKLTLNCNIDGESIPVSTSIKGIFLNTDGYVADDYFNVYRYGKIGNRIWMLDDLRAKPKDTLAYYTVKLESGLEMVLYYDYAYYDYEYIIPDGFRLPSYNDWLDLETYFGVTDDTIQKTYMVYNQDFYKYIPDSAGIKEHSYTPYNNIYDHYAGKGTGIRDFLIADNEWKDINNPNIRLEGKGHITGFNAHPAGIPYISDYEKMEIHNPYIGYGVAFKTTSAGVNWWGAHLKMILWSGCDGISKEISVDDDSKNEKDVVYSLYRCVKDE